MHGVCVLYSRLGKAAVNSLLISRSNLQAGETECRCKRVLVEYAVPSLTLNYPCKEYQIIYESVHIYLCTCMRNKYPCKSEFVWNVHVQVMLKLISFSILNMHELVETWLPEEQLLKFLDWQSNVHFPWPNELTICRDINEFQISP